MVRLEDHHGVSVWTDTVMDEMRKHLCLCLHCMNIETCKKAKKLYKMCVRENMAMAITRCPDWYAKVHDAPGGDEK